MTTTISLRGAEFPNIPRDCVSLSRSQYWIDIGTGAHRLRAYDAGKRVGKFRPVVGAPSTLTPTGLTAISERNRQPDTAGLHPPLMGVARRRTRQPRVRAGTVIGP